MSSEAATSGSTTVIENVEFRATAPATRLPGLDNAQRKLEALSAAIKQVQSQLAGISTNAMFKLSPQQYAAKAYDLHGKALTGVGQMARRIGFGPEAVKDVRRSADQLVSEVHAAIGKIDREIARNPGFGKKALAARQQQIQQLRNFLPFTNASASSFKNPGIAGLFFGGGLEEKIPKLPKGFSFSAPLREILKKGYAGVAMANRERGEAAMRAVLQGTVHGNGPAVYSPATVAAAVKQAINESAKDVKAATTASGGGGGGGGKKGKGGGGGKGGEEERVLEPADGPEVERRVEETPNAPDRITTTRRTGAYSTQAALEQEGKILKLTSRELTEKQTTDALRKHLAGLKKEYERDLPQARDKGGTFAKLRGNYATAAQKSFAGYETHQPMLDEFLHETLPAAEQKEMLRAGEQRKKLLKQRYKAEQADDQVKRANIQAELDSLEQHRKALGKFGQSGQRAAKDIARERKKEAAFTQKQQTQSLFNTVSTQAAMDVEADLQRRGAKLVKENHDLLTGRRTGATYLMEENGWLSKYRVEHRKEGDAVARKVSSVPAVKKPHDRLDQAMEGLTMRNMAANLVKVSAWSAAVMVLYKSAELAGYSMRQLVQTSMEMAHLDIVFRGVGGTVQELTTDMLKLAAVEGRATSETMQSAQSWARLGGDRKTINEEVRVSAEAANIANMHMAETSKQLQSLMHIYHLEASDLDSTLGGLVATSLRYNVTLEEMFTGLDRSAAAARVAGISLAELQGMLAVVTGTTGATGSTTGNALKYVFQELNKSEVQQQLRDKYKVETLDTKLNQKPVGQTLGDLSGIWGTLGDRSKQQLGGLLGGRFNAARVPVVIEQYPEILNQAINSQLGLNKAQMANAKIVDTIRANMAGLKAEYDRLIMSGNVLSRVNLGTAVGKNVMHDVANLFSGPAPSDAQQQAVNEQMQGNISKHWFWSQLAGVGRTIARMVTPLGLLNHFGVGMTGPGMMDYNKYLHDQDNVVEAAGDDRLEGFRKQERAGSLRGQSFGIAKTMLENNTMTDTNASIFAETMRGMGPAGALNATAFLNARGSGDKQGALDAVGRASGQAFNEQKKAMDSKQVMLEVQKKALEHRLEVTNKEIGDKDATPAQTATRDDLTRQLLKNRDAVDSLDGAYQELEGSIDTVQVTQQKYLNLLKTQEGLMAGIEERYTMVETHTPGQKLAQQVAMFSAQEAAAKQAIADYDATGDDTTEGKASRARLVEQWKKTQADLASAQARGGQANLLTAYQHGTVGSENLGRSANYGYTETDKLLHVRAELTRDAQRVEEELSHTVEGTVEHEELAGRLDKDRVLAYQQTLDLARRRADVEAEIHQLAIDQNREFSRSFFGSGAADMLRKLAAFKIAMGGRVTQGQLYSMNPAMRQDVGQLTGMNPDMARLLRERNVLSANGFADGGYTGDGNPNEIAGVVHKGEYVVSKDDLKFRPPMPPGGAWGANPKADTSHYRRHGQVQPTSMAERLAQGAALPAAALMLYKASKLSGLKLNSAKKMPWVGTPGITPEDMFARAHDNLVPRHATEFARSRFLPGGGVYRSTGGVPLDEFGHGTMRIPTQERWLGGWSPGDAARQAAAHERSQWAWSPGRGTTTAPWSPRGISFGQAVSNTASHPGGNWMTQGWTAARGFVSNPENWAHLGKGLGMGVIGAGVTGALNWAGGKVNPALGHSDTYGGAAFGLFSDAAGGAVAGSRGGPLGAGIGAVGGMVIGDVARGYGALRDIHRSYGSPEDKRAEAHRLALLQHQMDNPKSDAAFERQMAARRAASARDREAFARREATFDQGNARRDAAVAGIGRPHPTGPHHPTTVGQPPHTWATNPVTGLPIWDGRSAAHMPVGHTPAAPSPVTRTNGTGNNSAVMPVVRQPAGGGGGGSAAAGGDDTAVRNATAALDSLAGAAGKVTAAFTALATRADALFRAQPGNGGNGLQFAPTGQMGGSYPGRQS